MATSFDVPYNSFLEKITDYGLLSLVSETDRNTLLYGYMNRTCTQLTTISAIDLFDIDITLSQFNNDLDYELINVISAGMVVEWLKPKYYFDQHMKNVLNTSDYKVAASPANMMMAIKSTYEFAQKEFKQLKTDYSYNHGNIENLKPEGVER